MFVYSATNNVSALHPLCLAHWLVTIFFIPPAQTLESIMDCYGAAIHLARKVLSNFFESGIGMLLHKSIQLLKMRTSKCRLSALILGPGSNRALLFPLPTKLLDPSGGNLKLLGNLVQSVLARIVSI
jgi:hypothetical protein